MPANYWSRTGRPLQRSHIQKNTIKKPLSKIQHWPKLHTSGDVLPASQRCCIGKHVCHRPVARRCDAAPPPAQHSTAQHSAIGSTSGQWAFQGQGGHTLTSRHGGWLGPAAGRSATAPALPPLPLFSPPPPAAAAAFARCCCPRSCMSPSIFWRSTRSISPWTTRSWGTCKM